MLEGETAKLSQGRVSIAVFGMKTGKVGMKGAVWWNERVKQAVEEEGLLRLAE